MSIFSLQELKEINAKNKIDNMYDKNADIILADINNLLKEMWEMSEQSILPDRILIPIKLKGRGNFKRKRILKKAIKRALKERPNT